jgi:iron complex transport system permease protein
VTLRPTSTSMPSHRLPGPADLERGAPGIEKVETSAVPEGGVSADLGRRPRAPRELPHRASERRALVVASAALVGAALVGISVGPADLSLATVLRVLESHLPLVHVHPRVDPTADAIVWQVRLPRVVLGALVGAMLAGGGAAYQGVFRNPLADPYLLGIAAGAGLGATIAILAGAGVHSLLPVAAFAGGACAVVVTYLVGAGVGRSTSSGSIVLAGVAVAALLTSIQTYLQQQHSQTFQGVYTWILGRLSVATWSDVWLVLPYAAVSAAVLVAHRRALDVLRVGEEEAQSLGVNAARVRLLVVAGATVGTAAAVAVSGLIGFVGIIVPHTVRLAGGSSYRRVLPVSMLAGGAFLILADVVARTVESPGEIPIGVVTAFIGAPFFLFVLRSRRAQRTVR